MAHRTQITLTDSQYARLRAESATTGLSIAELIRRLVEGAFGGLTREEKLAALDASFGVWKDRDDLPASSADYVRALRGSGMNDRLRHLGVDPDR